VREVRGIVALDGPELGDGEVKRGWHRGKVDTA
jgi:hypothetical protein